MAETSWEEAMARPPAVQRDFSKGDPSGLKRLYLVSDGFESFSFEAEQPFAADKFQHFLERLSHDVFRAKGLLWIAERKKAICVSSRRPTVHTGRKPTARADEKPTGPDRVQPKSSSAAGSAGGVSCDLVIEPRPVRHRLPMPSGCLRRKLKSQPRSACRISRR